MHDVSSEAIGSLRSLQQRVLRDLAGRNAPGFAPPPVFDPPPRGTIADRWLIYRDGYVARIAEALENDFRATLRVLGSGAFRSLARRYVIDVPPAWFDIGRVGERLPGYLVSDPLSERLPFLADLAGLEWAQAEAFVAVDATPVTWRDLAALDPEAVADRPLRALPGTALIRSRWPIDEIWACRDLPDERVSVDLEDRPVTVLVWRRGLEVCTRGIDPDSARVVAGFQAGSTLAALTAAGPRPDDAGQVNTLLTQFRRLVDDGVFHSPGSPDQPAYRS